MNEQAGGTIVTALAWVSRGYAKSTLETFEPSEKELAKHQKLEKKVFKGAKGKEIGEAVKEMEKEIEKMDLGEDSDSDDNAPIFTPELAKLKAKE